MLYEFIHSLPKWALCMSILSSVIMPSKFQLQNTSIRKCVFFWVNGLLLTVNLFFCRSFFVGILFFLVKNLHKLMNVCCLCYCYILRALSQSFRSTNTNNQCFGTHLVGKVNLVIPKINNVTLKDDIQDKA